MTKRRNFFKKARLKSYKGKKFKNPYFKNKKFKLSKVVLISIFIFLSIATVIFFIFKSDFLKIKTIDITGLTTISDIELIDYINNEGLLGTGFFINNFLFIKKNNVKSALYEKYNFEIVEIVKKRNKITINVIEKISELIWRNNRTFYFIDMNGIILRELEPEEVNFVFKQLGMEYDTEAKMTLLQPNTPIIEDRSRSDINVGQEVLVSNMTQNILDFDKEIRTLAIKPAIYEIDKPKESWIKTKIINKPDIIFDGLSSPEEQINSIRLVMQKQQYKEREGGIEYIDVRFKNRVYIK